MPETADSEAGEDGPPNHLSEQTLNLVTTPNESLDTDETRRKICRRLYISHFLSTWNSRAFEFGAFLFLASIYPQTLLPASIYALARAASAAALSPWVGSHIDHAERLATVRLSIIGQRLAVALSCALFLALVQFDATRNSLLSYGSLAVLSVLACVEKLAAVMNTISVERDWIVIIAEHDEGCLRAMNSQMRRIDLFCKLIAPLSVASIDSVSSRAAILVTGAMTVLSFPLEYFAIARVYNAVPALKDVSRGTAATDRSTPKLWILLRNSLLSTLDYFRHPAFLPSFSLALLYLTVLSFNGQLITYLIAIGVRSNLVGVLRGVSALFELSATWIAPQVMQRIGPIRSGIWFINWQIFCVGIACVLLWLDLRPVLAAAATVGAVVASRIGLWGFDLSAQMIVQEEVEAEMRGAFSSQEFVFQNIFEMLSFASTIVFARPNQFKYPATLSAAAVGLAGVLYAAFVRARRGHLVHLSRCMERHGKIDGAYNRHGWRRVPQEENNGGDFEMPERIG